MEAQAYFVGGVHTDGFCDSQTPLYVNCTGYEKRNHPFTTKHKRRDWYLQLMDEGTLIIDEETRLEKGQFIIWRPNEIFQYELPDETQMGYYWVHFTGGYVEDLLRENNIEFGKVYSIEEENLKTIKREWHFLFRELMLKRSGFCSMAASLLMSIVVHLGRRRQMPASVETNSSLRKRLEHTVAYIHNHYTDAIDTATLAAMEHLSESYFREVFKTAFGVSPKTYIINLRMERASEMLRSTNLSVARVAEICGYTDELYFSRLFKKKTGVSPRAYRNEMKHTS